MSTGSLSNKQAALLHRLRSGTVRLGASAPPIQPIAAGKRLPISRAQRRILFEELLHPGNTFNGTLAIECHPDIDVGILSRSLDAVVARHAILRSNVVMADGEVWARYNDAGPIDLELYSLSDDGGDLDRSVAAVGNAFAGRHISIFSDTALIRAALIRIGGNQKLLLLAMHMYAFDAPSGAIFARELTMTYESLLAGNAPNLPPLDYQYADFVAWQTTHDRLDDDASVAFWRARLSDADEELRLPVDRARPTIPAFTAERFPFTLAPALGAALKAFARARGVSLYVLLLAVLKVTLARHSGQPSVSVGAWTVQRDARTAALIGPFVNTLVYRSAIDLDESFVTTLARVQETAATAYAHSRLPFETVVASSGVARDSRINPLFQVHFILQEMGKQETSDHFSLSRFDAVIGASGGYDVELVMRDLARGVEGHFECNTTLFSQGEAEQLRGRFLGLLPQVIERPDVAIGVFILKEPGMVLQGGRPVGIAADRNPRTGDSVALVKDDGTALSRADLDAQVAGLSQRIAAVIPISATVAIGCSDRTLALVGILSALHAGVPFVVEDARFPQDTGIRPMARLVPDPESFAGIAVRPIAATEQPTVHHAANMAYYAWSSGTAGKRRARPVRADRFEQYLAGIIAAYDLDSATVALVCAEPSSDVFLEETIPILRAGGRIVLTSRGPRGVTALSDTVASHGVTLLNLPTSYWEAWSRTMSAVGNQPPASLRTIVLGSEEVPVTSLRDWQRRFGNQVSILSAYGVSEHAVTSIVYRVPSDPASLDALPRIPIGKPIAGQIAFVADRAGAPLPPGAVGEIRLGYHDERDQSVGTGDQGRLRFDGDIEWLGRIDGRVKCLGTWLDDSPSIGPMYTDLAHTSIAAADAVGLLLVLWTRVLGNTPAADGNLFDQGAASMDFIQVLCALEPRFGPLPIAELYDRQSIAAQAEWLVRYAPQGEPVEGSPVYAAGEDMASGTSEYRTTA